MWPMLAMAGLGALEGKKKEEQAERDRQLAAQTALYSPWTGMKPDMSIDGGPGVAGGAATGALSGYAQQQKMDESAMDKALKEEQIRALQRQGTWGAMGGRPVGMSGPLLPGGGFYSGTGG